ncbi:MAG: FIST C-terminal domain-containing protein [Rubrivivax sp.]|jgi:small ligand-binding sensory domain FIST|nr:FIST C-terminal domain-containing protein [Rubrivivax sp.]
MQPFLVGHATHPDWRAALALAAAQIDGSQGQRHETSDAGPLALGFVYFSDLYAGAAEELFLALKQRWPGVAWVGCSAVGVCASGVEYIDEPALVLMLASVPVGRFELFSGANKLRRSEPHTALVHADPGTPDLADLVAEMSDRVDSGYLFGGLAQARSGTAVQLADGVFRGGLSGVAFTQDVALVSRVTQGCQPVGPAHTVTACDRNVATGLDGRPALAVLLDDLGLSADALARPREALPRLRSTLVGLSPAEQSVFARGGQFGTEVRVRHLIGLDPGRDAFAVAEMLQPGQRLTFCQRDTAAARRDLVRICSEIRDELAGDGSDAMPPRDIAGAIYVSCSGRGGPHFGGASAELKIVQHALGEVPLVGFFAGGEIAHQHLHGYTGVLTVFTTAAARG